MLYFSICIRKCIPGFTFSCSQTLLNDSKPVLPPCSAKTQIYNIFSFHTIRKSIFLTQYSSLSMLIFNSTHCLATLSFEVPNASLHIGLASESTIMTIFLQGFYPQTPFSIVLFNRICNFCRHVSLKVFEALFILHYACLCSLIVLHLVQDTG